MESQFTPKQYVISIVAGWLLIGSLFALYVVGQHGLIASVWKLVFIVIGGCVFGFFFSALEAALLSSSETERKAVLEQKEKNSADFDNGGIASNVHEKRQAKLTAYLKAYTKKRLTVPPLIIFSNASNIVTTSLLAGTFVKLTGNPPAIGRIPLAPVSTWIHLPFDGITISGSAAALNFFSCAVFLLIFGKIAPKKLGSNARARRWLVSNCSQFICGLAVVAGWFGVAVNAPLDPFLKEE